MATYKPQKEVVLYGNLKKDVQIPEIKLRYNRGKPFKKTNTSKDVYEFLKKVYGRSIGIQEQFVVLLIDRALNIIGYYKHTVGTPVGVIVDIPMIVSVALKSMARSVIVSHNHPSGNKTPSEADIKLTKEIRNALESVKIDLIDNIIATKDGYYSFADEGFLGLGNTKTDKKQNLEQRLRQEVFEQLQKVNQNKMLTPKIYDLIQTENGYRHIEERIISMVINDGITISACIPQIESELM